jgi:excinuclease ABC subunit A
MQRVGLGYLVLGQSALTLSGGEAQRLKLVRALAGSGKGRLYILDEPTVGLHQSEVYRLAAVLDELVDAGNSVLVVEHNVDILAGCDWLLELGPEAGAGGGRLVAAGPPAVVARHPGSPTGPFLGGCLPGLSRPRTEVEV